MEPPTGPRRCPGHTPPAARARSTPRPPVRHLRGRRSRLSAAPWIPGQLSSPGGTTNSSRQTGARRGPPCPSLDLRASPPRPGCRKEVRSGGGARAAIGRNLAVGGASAAAITATPGGAWGPFLWWEKEGWGFGSCRWMKEQKKLSFSQTVPRTVHPGAPFLLIKIFFFLMFRSCLKKYTI